MARPGARQRLFRKIVDSGGSIARKDLLAWALKQGISSRTFLKFERTAVKNELLVRELDQHTGLIMYHLGFGLGLEAPWTERRDRDELLRGSVPILEERRRHMERSRCLADLLRRRPASFEPGTAVLEPLLLEEVPKMLGLLSVLLIRCSRVRSVELARGQMESNIEWLVKPWLMDLATIWWAGRAGETGSELAAVRAFSALLEAIDDRIGSEMSPSNPRVEEWPLGLLERFRDVSCTTVARVPPGVMVRFEPGTPVPRELGRMPTWIPVTEDRRKWLLQAREGLHGRRERLHEEIRRLEATGKGRDTQARIDQLYTQMTPLYALRDTGDEIHSMSPREIRQIPTLKELEEYLDELEKPAVRPSGGDRPRQQAMR